MRDIVSHKNSVELKMEAQSHSIIESELNHMKFGPLSMVDPNAKKYNPDTIRGFNWNNKLAAQRVFETMDLLGRKPDLIDPKPGGCAIWYKPSLFFGKGKSLYNSLEIKDGAYYHEKPAEHLDFYFLSLKYHVKPDKQSKIHRITGSAYYYSVGGLLYAGCHFPGASIVTFDIIKEYNEDMISLEDARELYNGRIARAMEEYMKGANSGQIKNKNNWGYIRTLERYVNDIE